MHRSTHTVICTALLAGALVAAGARAAEVFRTTDARGQPIYTDKPETLPAEKLNIASATTDVVAAGRRYDEQMQRYADQVESARGDASAADRPPKATELSEEQRAQRCGDARKRYDSYMSSHRLYEQGASESERRYLTDTEIDAAREQARKVMQEFCGP